MKKIIFVFLSISFLILFSVPTAAVSTSAQSAVLINADTGCVIYSYNMDQRLPMASTTKIMTGLLLAEENTPEKHIVVTKEMVTVEGSSMGLLAGDTVSYNDLLYGLMLASGNDAANTIAISLCGSTQKFADKM
ncbi:MAG: D-alanyl-D-alanine carboxypeptidase, partial [Clostridia bacterium]|nr:D-alanyl-D-alanine carboxypeptidase [Clostridia bacterium]